MNIRTLKGASGLGDSIYIRMVAQYFYEKDKSTFFLIMSDFPDLFIGLPCHIVRHTKLNEIEYQGRKYHTNKISYCGRKYKNDTTQFEDVCIAAGVPKDISYSLDWKIKNNTLINGIKKSASIKRKPICLITSPYRPFGRIDNWGKEITVNFDCMKKLINSKKNDFYFVMTCKDTPIYRLENIDCNLSMKTNISDLLDIASISNVIIGQIGHALPIAECLNKPALIFFSKNGMSCGNTFLESITPKKTIHKKNLVKHIIDNESDECIRRTFESLNIK